MAGLILSIRALILPSRARASGQFSTRSTSSAGHSYEPGSTTYTMPLREPMACTRTTRSSSGRSRHRVQAHGWMRERPDRGGPYAEDDAPRPISVYGETKLAGERAVCDADPSALVIRTTVVYGLDAQQSSAWQIVTIGGEAGRIIEPTAFAVEPNGTWEANMRFGVRHARGVPVVGWR